MSIDGTCDMLVVLEACPTCEQPIRSERCGISGALRLQLTNQHVCQWHLAEVEQNMRALSKEMGWE